MISSPFKRVGGPFGFSLLEHFFHFTDFPFDLNCIFGRFLRLFCFTFWALFMLDSCPAGASG